MHRGVERHGDEPTIIEGPPESQGGLGRLVADWFLEPGTEEQPSGRLEAHLDERRHDVLREGGIAGARLLMILAVARARPHPPLLPYPALPRQLVHVMRRLLLVEAQMAVQEAWRVPGEEVTMSGAPVLVVRTPLEEIRVDGQRLRPAPGREPRRGKIGAEPDIVRRFLDERSQDLRRPLGRPAVDLEARLQSPDPRRARIHEQEPGEIGFRPVREARVEKELDVVRPKREIVWVLGEQGGEGGEGLLRAAESREKAGADGLGLASVLLGLRRSWSLRRGGDRGRRGLRRSALWSLDGRRRPLGGGRGDSGRRDCQGDQEPDHDGRPISWLTVVEEAARPSRIRPGRVPRRARPCRSRPAGSALRSRHP